MVLQLAPRLRDHRVTNSQHGEELADGLRPRPAGAQVRVQSGVFETLVGLRAFVDFLRVGREIISCFGTGDSWCNKIWFILMQIN